MFLQGPWEQCQLLKSASVFARCHPLVDPEPFVALCERTLCTCAQGMRCPCAALLEYARACAHQGMVLYGWTVHSECRKSLPAFPRWGGALGLGKSRVCPGVSLRKLSVCVMIMCLYHTPANQHLQSCHIPGPISCMALALCHLIIECWSQRESPPLKPTARLERPSQGPHGHFSCLCSHVMPP